MKKSSIVLIVGIILFCMGTKFNSVAMNRVSGGGLMTSSGLSDADRAALQDQIKKLDAQIAQKEQELERAGRFEEFAVAKELNALRKKRSDTASMFTLNLVLDQPGLRELIPAKQCKLTPSIYSFNVLFHGAPVYSVVWSPDGSKIVTRGDAFAKVWDMTMGTQIGTDLFHGGAGLWDVAWSPDNSKLATAAGDYVKIWNALTVEPIGLHLGHLRRVDKVVFSPDGKKLAVLVQGVGLNIWNVATRSSIKFLPNIKISSVAWSPDGSNLAIGSDNRIVEIVRVANWHVDFHIMIQSGVWSPDGTKLAGTSYDNIAIWDAANLISIGGATLKHIGGLNSVAWSPDGTKLATGGSRSGTVKIWDVATGTQVGHDLLNGNLGIKSIGWSPDGTKLVVLFPDCARIWDATKGLLIEYDLCQKDSILSAAWSPDGKKLATGYGDGKARIWNVAAIIEITKFLAEKNLNIDQCELLQAFDLAIQDKGRIQATEDQWHTFTTFPKAVQDVLRLYIKEPTIEEPAPLSNTKRKAMEKRVGKSLNKMWAREQKKGQKK